MSHYERLVPDTSVIIEALITREMEADELSCDEIIIPEAVLAELEHQANQGLAKGHIGLDEVERIVAFGRERGFGVRFSGSRPTAAQILKAAEGEIDAAIRQLAYDEGATFVTQDKVQAKVARAKGMDVHLVEPTDEHQTLELEGFFDDQTMSVHLREATPPTAKKGSPGDWGFVEIDAKPLSRNDVKRISSEIIEVAGQMKSGFVEIERPGSTIVQLGRYRIVITRPPLSDAWEITAVRPVKKLSLEDYKLSEKLQHRLSEQAEGILIAGSPGMGKTTFAAALIEHYAEQDKICKTIEAPRDLVLPETITQYAISHGDQTEIHDILLLSRPDYTLFDEMRTTKDFLLYADLRLSGIGLAGVIHATKAVDAIQRLIGKVELGMIPQIVDTVVFIKNGRVDTVLALHMTVKVPHGMTEDDLARPVVVINDFESNKSLYELYTYGEQTVAVPVTGEKTEKPAHLKLAAESVKDYFKAYSPLAQAEMVSANRAAVYVPEKVISQIIGKGGQNINRIEKEVGVSIDIRPLDDYDVESIAVEYEHRSNKSSVTFMFDSDMAERSVDFVVDGELVMSGQIGKDGKVRVTKKNKLGKLIEKAAKSGDLSVVVE